MSFTALIHESVGFVGHGSNVRCTVSLPEDLWSVEADPGQMSQVIHNLLLNAQQAMPDGGTIALQGANLLLGEDADLPLPAGRYVTITIRDQGCGIPESHLAQIFDPYFTTKQSGSGLGLATTYAIMQKHDGYVHVASTLGVGTTFCLYLPASPGAVPPRPQGLDSPQAGQGCILLMDDEAMLRELGSAILTRLGYEVETAQDGAEALELYQRAQAAGQPFAAVILDLTIPGGMGGQEALTALLRLDPQVTAIVSSGYSQDPVMANCTAYGFRDVVTKPYTVQELSDTLQRVLRGGGRHAETEGKNAL